VAQVDELRTCVEQVFYSQPEPFIIGVRQVKSAYDCVDLVDAHYSSGLPDGVDDSSVGTSGEND